MCVRVFVTEFALPSFKSALKVARRDSLAASRKRRRVCLSVCVCVETAVVTHLFGTRWRRTRARDAASNPMCAKKSAFLIGRSATSARQQRRRSYSPHRSLGGVGVGGGGGLIFQPPTCDGLEICSRLPLSFFFSSLPSLAVSTRSASSQRQPPESAANALNVQDASGMRGCGATLKVACSL